MKPTTTPEGSWMRFAAWIAVAAMPGLHLAGCGAAAVDDTDEADAEVGDVDDGIEVRDDADVPREDGDGAPCLCTDDSDCDDDEPCNGAESCVECACIPGEPLAAGAPCEDGDQCTEGETCGEGVCGGGSPSCPCESDDDCLEHDDGDLCNGRPVCLGGFCAFDEGTVVTCDTSDDTDCLVNRCLPATGECEMTPQPDGTACEDGSRCTEGERCSAGACAGGTPVCECSTTADCEAHDDDDLCNGRLRCGSGGFCEIDPATVVHCNPSGDTACSVNRCVPVTGDCVMTPRPDGTSCDDGNACTLGDACSSGACVPMAMRECRDTNPCTDDSCAPATGCVFANNTASCNDGNACTVEDRCSDGACAGTPRNCDDDNVCTTDSCDPLTGCVRTNNTLPCDDGLYCNGNDTCSGGSCSVHLGNPCPGHNVGPNCNDSCNEDGDNCTANDLNGTTCNDGDACTAAPDVCSAGTCVGGPCTSACRWWPD
ncbi:MAG: hypothetical protein QME96_13810, partial [Myxococcota bacterium]|nr:hypothetical protein [Myxococcota bacterium]